MATKIFVKELRTMIEVNSENRNFLRKFGYIKDSGNDSDTKIDVKRTGANVKRVSRSKSAK